jgi:hypothetical protein
MRQKSDLHPVTGTGTVEVGRRERNAGPPWSPGGSNGTVLEDVGFKSLFPYFPSMNTIGLTPDA